MTNAQAIAEACPVCGSDASYDFTGSDFMFVTPGDYDRCNQCGAVFQVPMPGATAVCMAGKSDWPG